MSTHDDRLVGVQYQQGFFAPKILFKAKGLQGQPVLLLAKKYNIPIRHESELLDVLFPLPEGSYIPESQFALVAKILTEIYNFHDKFTPKPHHQDV
jgi:flagellar biosynthesis protein